MKTDTELLNEIAQKSDILRQLTQEEALKLKKTLLEMHNNIIELCDKHHLTVMLGGGSCLGTIRHKGIYLGIILYVLVSSHSAQP